MPADFLNKTLAKFLPRKNGETPDRKGPLLFHREPRGFRARLIARVTGRGSRRPGRLLQVLIKVFAGFTKVDGEIIEGEIDSSLGFLRYDYPEAVYSELQRQYKDALDQAQDLDGMGVELSTELTLEEKIMLGVQLFVLISRSGRKQEQLRAFYAFMTNLGVASEAIDLVYQLNTDEPREVESGEDSGQPLETLQIGNHPPADIVIESLSGEYSLMAYRFQNLVLVKNTGKASALVRGRRFDPGQFHRVYEGQSIFLDEHVFSYQDLGFYFNVKKGVSATELFLAVTPDGQILAEKSRTKHSRLDIQFGLKVKVRVLEGLRARLRGVALNKKGAVIEASLLDKIVFENNSELSLRELRSRARQLGGRFELTPSKTEYLVSNNPNLLNPGDILLSSGADGEVLLKIKCNYEQKTGELTVINTGQPILVQSSPVRDTTGLKDGDTITIAEGQFLSCNFSERILEEERNIISRLEVQDLWHSYDNKETALDSIGFTARRGQLICVLGPSGSGKSTLLRALGGHLKPDQGRIRLNGEHLYENLDSLRPYISLISQEEAFDPLLTVEENLNHAATIRSPHLRAKERNRRNDSRIIELGLNERRHRLAGTAYSKNLSGGERKRLNIGLDMVSMSDVYLIDEPTSGLSSKDSEHVMEIIRSLAHNKIVIVSIHQPSARLFHMFDKALLIDTGGKMAFFGAPNEMLDYFRDAYKESGDTLAPGEVLDCPTGSLQPDFVFDVLETPLRDLSGGIIYEHDNRGGLVPARRFQPNFWRDRFQAHRLIQEVGQVSITPESPPQPPMPLARRKSPLRRLRQEATLLSAVLKRSLLSKLRNRANLATTLLEAPVLALLIAGALRYPNPVGGYTFASAFHIPTFIFLTLIVAMFLGLTNSADDIIRDRAILERERNHNVRISYYIFSKFFALAIFACLQCIVYLWIANRILGIHNMFWHHWIWMVLTSLAGVSIGLFISSLVSDAKTATNIVPLILVPQIILGGALIKYEEMNKNVDFLYSLKRLFIKRGETVSDERMRKLRELQVPAICELMPLRWSYEGMVLTQAKLNPLTSRQDVLNETIHRIAKRSGKLTEEELTRLDQAKNALAFISGLEGRNSREVHGTLVEVDRALEEGRFQTDDFPPGGEGDPRSAESLYVNQKVSDLVTKARAKFTDYRHRDDPPNVFFGERKKYFGRTFKTRGVNVLVINLFSLIFLAAVYAVLRRQLGRV